MADGAMYARLGRHGKLLESPPSISRASLLFVDLDVRLASDVEVALAHVRFLAPVALGHVAQLVIRWPLEDPPTAEQLEGLFETARRHRDGLGMHCAVGIAIGALGQPPTIRWGTDSLAKSGPSEIDDVHCLTICRAIEVWWLLFEGRGIWTPDHYHYRLPSGRHSGTFVRLADAVRSVRDAEVLAWWLWERAAPRLGVVCDSATVLPIVLALQKAMLKAGLEPGPTDVLRAYPATPFDFAKTARAVAIPSSFLLGLLSVSSSGSVRSSFGDALRAASDDDAWALETFVDKSMDSASSAEALQLSSGGAVPWLGLGDPGEATAESCRWCRDPARARVVHIDPSSFDGLVLPSPQLLTPDIRYADRARHFWELCDAAGALALDAEAHPTAAHVRPQNSTMGIRVDFDPLLTMARRSADSGGGTDPFDLVPLVASEFRPAPTIDLVVGSQSELDRADGGGRWLAQELFKQLAPNARHVELRPEDQQDEALVSAICEATHIGIFALGVVSGTSLHRLLATVSQIRRSGGLPAADLDVFVVHARPHSDRALETIANPFGKERFHSAFTTLLPDASAQSPLGLELDFLRQIDAPQDSGAAAFLDARLEALRSGGGDSFAVMWGIEDPSTPANRLRPGSLYGESLSSLAAFVAVGAAVQRRRQEAGSRGAPEWRQFEIPAITQSYFDPLIVCAVIRWLQPEECWWGRELSDSRGVMERFLGGYTEIAEQRIVAAEFLLAAAQGKVPAPATDVLVDRANAIAGLDEAKGGSLRLGLELVKRLVTRDQ